jgi:transposase
MGQRRQFSAEFKRGAVAQTSAPGIRMQHGADELGISAGMLSRWRRQLGTEGRRAFGGHGKPRDEEFEVLPKNWTGA